jgi:hypothetical protein
LVNQQAANYNTPPARERSYGFANNRKYSVLVSVDKIKKEKAKGTWNSPSPDHYQTVVVKVLHKINSPAGKQKGLSY